MKLAVGLSLLSGCHLVFEEAQPATQDATAATDAMIDAVPAEMRVSLPFLNPTALGLPGADPTLTSDGGELWLTQSGSPDTLATSFRVGATYPTPVVAAFSSPAGEFDAALTADDKLVAYSSNRSGLAVFQRKRGVGPGVWQTETLAVKTSYQGFDMSPDGKTLYLLDSGKLRIMKRGMRDATFENSGLPEQQLDNNASYPTMSFDEREIIFNVPNGQGGYTLMQAIRAVNEIDYGAPTALALGCGNTADADFSADAMAIVYTCEGQIYVARR